MHYQFDDGPYWLELAYMCLLHFTIDGAIFIDFLTGSQHAAVLFEIHLP